MNSISSIDISVLMLFYLFLFEWALVVLFPQETCPSLTCWICAMTCLWYSTILLASVGKVLMSPLPFLLFRICVFSTFFLVNFHRDLTLLIFSKKVLVPLIFLVLFFSSQSVLFSIITVNIISLLGLRLICSSFTSSLTRELKSLTRDCFSFLI